MQRPQPTRKQMTPRRCYNEISLTQKVDETLLGGYVIKTLNTEYDRSYEGKLRELERKLTRR